MATKMTLNQVKKMGLPIKKIPYCGMQYALRPFERFAYATGTYGWKCDFYLIGGGDSINRVSADR